MTPTNDPSANPTSYPTTSPTQCYENACYFRGDESISWSNAKVYCEEMGAVLTSIHSSGENGFLWSEFGGGWFGLSDADNETFWKWVDGSQINYVNWKSGEPNNAGGDQHYAFFPEGWGGKWDDYADSARSFPICKKLTTQPTSHPTMTPTNDPSANPTSYPTSDPTEIPTTVPTQSPIPSSKPTEIPTLSPTLKPTIVEDGDDMFGVDGLSTLAVAVWVTSVVFCCFALIVFCTSIFWVRNKMLKTQKVYAVNSTLNDGDWTGGEKVTDGDNL